MLGAVCYIPGVEYRTGQVLSRAATGGLQRIAGPAALEGRTVWVILPWKHGGSFSTSMKDRLGHVVADELRAMVAANKTWTLGGQAGGFSCCTSI